MANEQIMVTVGAGDVTAITKIVWSEILHYEAANKMFWMKLMGDEGSGMPVILKSELIRETGDTVKVRRANQLRVDPTTGRQKGAEEKLVVVPLAITPVLYRKSTAHEVIVPYVTGLNYDALSVKMIASNIANYADKSMWAVATGTGTGGFGATAIKRCFSGNATSLVDIDSTDIFTLDDIDKMKAYLEEENALPCGGPDGLFILIVHPRMLRDLKKSDDYREYNANADYTGDAVNWLYVGGKPYPGIGDLKIEGKWNGVALLSSNNCPLVNSSGSPVIKTACGVMLGQEALARGVGAYMTPDGTTVGFMTLDKEVDDFGSAIGYCGGYRFADVKMTSEYACQIVSAAVAA